MADIIQADIDLCVELNIPDHQAHVIARYRLAQIAALEEPSPELVEAAARAILLHNWPSLSNAEIDDMWDGHVGNVKAALAAAALHLKENG